MFAIIFLLNLWPLTSTGNFLITGFQFNFYTNKFLFVL